MNDPKRIAIEKQNPYYRRYSPTQFFTLGGVLLQNGQQRCFRIVGRRAVRAAQYYQPR